MNVLLILRNVLFLTHSETKEENLCEFLRKSCVQKAILNFGGAQSLPGKCRIALWLKHGCNHRKNTVGLCSLVEKVTTQDCVQKVAQANMTTFKYTKNLYRFHNKWRHKSKLIFTVYSAKTFNISHLEPVSFASYCEDGVKKMLSRHNIVNRGYGRISC